MKSWSSPSVPSLPGTPPPLRLHDTRTGSMQQMPAGHGGGLYVCGITPYDATHMGHAATYLTFDLLLRQWRDACIRPTYVQNVTDVDEPLLERAERDGVAWQDLASSEIDLFREDMTALRILPPHHYVGAVEGVPWDVEAIEAMVDSGVAYRLPVNADATPGADDAGSDVYLDLAQVETFAEVSGWSRENMLAVFAERGGDPERAGKRDPLDPLLWRAEREGEPSWDGGRLGRGRPGWHIECTTIARKHLGVPFEVQGGGDDLVFPHHEMSAAQSRALDPHVPFAQYYVHQAMVGWQGEKMSKSKGNLVLVSRLRGDGVDPMAIRLALLDHHHGSAWEWTDEGLATAQQRARTWSAVLGPAQARVTDPEVCHSPEWSAPVQPEVIAQMREALANDLDSPAAVRAVDAWLAQNPTDADEIAQVADAVDALLGIRF